MNYFQIILFILYCSVVLSCRSKPETNPIPAQLAALNDQLMALHDSTMVKHGEALSLIDKLKIITNNPGNQNITMVDSIRTELDQSNESMMDWMANYEDPIEKDSAAINYLHTQIDIMHKISVHQLQNIALAKKILQNGN